MIRRDRSKPERVNHLDRSNGWEAVAPDFIKYSSQSSIGVGTIRRWAREFPQGSSMLDLGCGPGTLRSEALQNKGLEVYAVDAAPTMATSYQSRFPAARVACEPAEESSFFSQKFDGVLAWGLIFLLPAETQRSLIHRVARALKTGGRFLFTAPVQSCTWDDLSTGLPSLSLGVSAYTSIIAEAGLGLVAEYTDEGENHYYDTIKL